MVRFLSALDTEFARNFAAQDLGRYAAQVSIMGETLFDRETAPGAESMELNGGALREGQHSGHCVAPGHIRSPMVARHSSGDMFNLRRRAGPLGIEGTAWVVAWAAQFLASDEARWISGVTLPVDAGLLAATPLAMFPHLSGPE